MNEITFRTNFIATFIATWVANHYDEYCSQGKHRLLENPPIEDAEYLADKIIDKMRETTLKYYFN